MESVILGSSLLVVLYGIAMLICIFDIFKFASGYVFPLISALIFAGTTAYAVIIGASLEEIGAVTLVFLALNLVAFIRNRGNCQ